MPAKVILLNQGTTSWTVPADWNALANTIEAIGAGGAGGDQQGQYAGGGGAYAKLVNWSGSGAITVQVGLGRSAGAGSTDTWFQSTSVLLAKAGVTDGDYGHAAACVPSVGAYNGGNDAAGNLYGGGAAGPHGAGGNSSPTAGGAGDAGSGGAGGASGAVGGDGAEWTSVPGGVTAGAGGGGGTGTGGFAGGNYGGGGGTGLLGGGAKGGDGLIVITYTPASGFLRLSPHGSLGMPIGNAGLDGGCSA